ncbi:MAG: hypothetical protein HN521_21330 [Candidatus Latescibacteria bacterium]|nr:hypothetical protein [Candidatus Latescibacterota bacterium]MBT5828791.1 hypothetical protein [Candidatus Latescibacterota bacterium]
MENCNLPLSAHRTHSPSRDFTLDDIAKIIRNFQTATEMCAEAGFDGVEPQGAHNYPINQFFSPERNTRIDAYGGSFANHMRFALPIVSSVRHITNLTTEALPENNPNKTRHHRLWWFHDVCNQRCCNPHLLA